MTNLSKDICFKFKEARKAKGMNQSSLARAMGCQQSAISMFEGGDATKLSDETVKKLADFFGIKIEEEQKKEEAVAASGADEGQVSQASKEQTFATHGYCPNCQCPSNLPYVVDGRIFYRPNRAVASPTGGKYCAVCGELLEMRCPVCGAPLNDGACCAMCGSSYVTPVLPEGMDVSAYAKVRRDEIRQIMV